MTSGDVLQGSAIVVAHPDDEVLWLSSLLRRVDEVIIAFLDFAPRPDWSAGRRRSLESYPLGHVGCLGLAEPQSFGAAAWPSPVATPFGLEIADPRVERRYRRTFGALLRALRPRLAGRARVFSHNPWGEYGHEDHVQLFRVLERLSRELGFELWTSSYCSPRSQGLAEPFRAPSADDLLTLPVDAELTRQIYELYADNQCWTWHKGWRWPSHETFFRADALRLAAGERAAEPSLVTQLRFVTLDL